jgi:flagellar protein FliS
MEQSANESYLEAQVMTATPQKLRLMLIEAAIRFARRTLLLWEEGDNEQALETIIRCRQVVSELLASIRIDDSALTRHVSSLYVFIFRHLTEAQLRRDASHVEEAIRVLEVEHETWRLVCEQMPEAPMAQDPSATAEILAPRVVDCGSTMTGGSLSLEA